MADTDDDENDVWWWLMIMIVMMIMIQMIYDDNGIMSVVVVKVRNMMFLIDATDDNKTIGTVKWIWVIDCDYWWETENYDDDEDICDTNRNSEKV